MTTAQNTDFNQVLIDGLREAGITADPETATRIQGYLRNKGAHIHFAGDGEEQDSWHENAMSSVKAAPKDRVTLTSTPRDLGEGNFAYICVDKQQGRNLLNMLERELNN